jgi:hypothetical protein
MFNKFKNKNKPEPLRADSESARSRRDNNLSKTQQALAKVMFKTTYQPPNTAVQVNRT